MVPRFFSHIVTIKLSTINEYRMTSYGRTDYLYELEEVL